MYEGEATWSAVDRYFIDHLVTEDDTLRDARDSAATTEMPQGEVAPNQGALLAIVAQIAGARRVLEFGTLTGYSTIWLARAVGPSGRVVTFEIDEATAEIAKHNWLFAFEGVAGLARR